MPNKIVVCEKCEDKIDPTSSYKKCKYCAPKTNTDTLSIIREICPTVLHSDETIFFMSPPERSIVSHLITNKRVLEIKKKNPLFNFINAGTPNIITREINLRNIALVHDPKAERWTQNASYWCTVETFKEKHKFKFFNFDKASNFTLKIKEAVAEFCKYQ